MQALRWYLTWREQTLTEERRNCLSKWLLRVCLAALIVGFVVDRVSGQSQDAINATVQARLEASSLRSEMLEKRIDRIDNLLQFGLLGVFGNLVAHLLQLGVAQKRGAK
jgi:hypothetical protein